MVSINGYIIPRIPVGVSSFLANTRLFRAGVPRLRLPLPAKQGRLVGAVKQDLRQSVRGFVAQSYYSELYSRVSVIPSVINLGAISTEQVITVHIWNALRKPITIQSVGAQNAEGIEVRPQLLPKKLNGLALSRWVVRVNMTGPSEIDATITWVIDGHAPVSLVITGSRSTDWMFFPNWGQDVVETLEFMTAVHQSYSGAEQRISRRISPRRTLEFQVLLSGSERQLFDNALYTYGGRTWALPIFTDGVRLNQAVNVGSTVLQLDTFGRDFVLHHQILLVDKAGRRETAEVKLINPGEIRLERPLRASYDEMTWVYPIRSAILTDYPQVRAVTDSVASAQIRFALTEHNDWSRDIGHLPMYRGFPVLEPSSDWSEDLTAQYMRLIAEYDNQTGKRHRFDTAKTTFQLRSHRFIVKGRDEQNLLRRAFYYLNGRQKPIWVSTSSTDVTPVGDLLGKSVDAVNCGYSTMLQHQIGRQDVRIETYDGQVIYRRILAASVIDNNTERLGFDGDSIVVKQHHIAKISFMTLSRLDSDTISWEHKTDADGVAVVQVNFRSVREELEKGRQT